MVAETSGFGRMTAFQLTEPISFGFGLVGSTAPDKSDKRVTNRHHREVHFRSCQSAAIRSRSIRPIANQLNGFRQLKTPIRRIRWFVRPFEFKGSSACQKRPMLSRRMQFRVAQRFEEPRCYGQEPRPFRLLFPTSNFGVNFALELWAFAFTLARRQRRLALVC